MKVNIKAIFVTLILMTAGISTSVYAEPNLTIQDEAAANPNLTNAIHAMDDALKYLESTPNEFGGNKAKAIADLRSAIGSTRKALDYHLQKDEDHYDGSMMQ